MPPSRLLASQGTNRRPEGDGGPASAGAMGSETALRLVGVVKSYPLPQGTLEVLRGVDCEVPRGTILAILGASGAGKSTLLHLAGGLDRCDVGAIWVAGRELGALDGEGLARLRCQRVGFVFQFHHLLPEFSALENVMMPGLLARRPRPEVRAAAEGLLEGVGLADRRAHRPAELSGGERQRVAVARALINAPEVVLADEPSGNLDPANAARLHDLLLSLSRERRQTVVVATHSPLLARLATRVVVLDGGRLREATAGDEERT